MAQHRTITNLKLICVLAASLFALAAEAAQLGDIRTQSPIGKPLDATVGLWLTAKDKAQPLRLKLSPDLAYRANKKNSALVDRMTAAIATSASGQTYIQLRSSSPIDEPVLAFRIKLYIGENAVMRNYSIALNPTPSARASVRRKTTRNTQALAPIAGANYSVVAGDTLWAIARRVSRAAGSDTSALVAQIFADNPQAFVNGNKDRLILGATLRVADNVAAATPTPNDVVPSIPPAQAVIDVAADETVTPVVPTAQPDAVTVAAATAATPGVAARAPVDWRVRDPKLAAELEALRLKYIALKEQYALQQNPQADATPATSPTTAEPDAPAVNEQAGAVEAIADVPVQPVAPTAETESAAGMPANPALPPARTFGLDVAMGAPPVVLAILALGALALIGLITVGVRKVIGRSSKRHAELAHHAKEADFKAEVARKAASRVQMESEVQRMLANREEPTVTAAAPSAASAAPTVVSGAEAEIDHNIAHGRYGEAETQLLDVIAQNPKNFSAKLRLIEVYYMTEQVSPFCELADDLHSNHRADISDEEWSRVVRMGKITAPDRMPFSGPRGLDNTNAAS